jgi:aldehyde:ferredoxin oxidoreductase
MPGEIFAYAGKILRVNLSNGEISTEPADKYAREWLGASGIATKMLYDEVKPWVTPYSPTNRLIISSGTLVGTMAPGASRINGNSINAMTGGFGSTNSDSHLGGELKFAGYDAIVIAGKAHQPVYLWIDDEKVEILDASCLWGEDTWKTVDLIRQLHQDRGIHVLSIGPAGENVVRGACIIQDKGRAMGRCGLGGIMGSKNLKAIAVRGSGSIRIAQPDRFMNTVDKARASMSAKSVTAPLLHRIGTLGALAKKQQVCGVPYKNFQVLSLPEDLFENLNIDRLVAKHLVRNVSYPACAIGCSRHFRLSEGPYAGLEAEACQFEALCSLQTKLGVYEPTFMIKANAYCNQMGLDIDLAGGSIAWAMECYQRGLINENDTDGLNLEWGNAEVILELIRKICFREGFGDILSEGSAKAADIIDRNSDYYAIHVKGQDLYEVCRGAVGWCLAVATATRGGTHTVGAPACETIPGFDTEEAEKVLGVSTAGDALAYEGKARLVQYYEHLHRINNSLGICHMNTTWYDPSHVGLPELAELYSAATGWETTADQLAQIAERQLNLEKAFNLLRTDFDRKDDYPPPREMNEPIPSGNVAGWKIDEEKYDSLLDEYYELHNWDKETSFPTRKCLEDLDLHYVAEDLEKVGKLR